MPLPDERKPARIAVRIATGLTLGVVILAAVFWGRLIGLAAVVSVIAVASATEVYEITRRELRLPNEVFGLLAVAAMPFAAALSGLEGLTGVMSALIAAALLWHLGFRSIRTSDTAVTVFGAVYVGFTLSHLVLIRNLDSGTILVLATIVSVWANDVFAYLIGVSLGRHKLAPRISPAKTWEGFAAGTLFTVAVWIVVHYVADTNLTLGWHIIIGLFASVAAVVGDLTESRLKREAGVKDSGRRLPGHGGFLDRFDSLIFVSIVTYYLLLLAGAR